MDTEFLPLQDALAGEYSFERELGRGGMDVVYLAREVQLDRPVAIKVLPAALAARDEVRARFLKEARTAANLSHPNIVPIHRVGELAGIPTVAPASMDVARQPLAAAVARCLSGDPRNRYADAESLVSALDATTAVARSSLPPVLRTWASDQTPLLPLYGFLSFTGLGSALIASVSGLGGVRWEFPALVSLGSITLPAIPVLVYQLRKTKRALAEGYRLSDLRFALRTWKAERLAEGDRVGGETRWSRLASSLPLLSAAVYVTSAAALLRNPVPALVWPAVVLAKLSLFVGIVSLASLSVFGLPLLPKSWHRRMIGRARGWLWNSRFGSWIADRLAPKSGGVPLAAFRPTEMALEVAIDDLFAALSDEYRESLRELPAIARRLTTRAAELREALTIDVSSEGDLDHTWEKLKSANSARLNETVTALERLRIGLLRLHGGMADLRPLTTALDAARAIDRDVRRLVEGQAEVSGVRRVLSFERRSPSPA